MTNQEIDGARIVVDVLAGLKGFQRKTVDHVFRRMYDDAEPATRFLVADEVGLGKTLVARGLIAKTIERLQTQRVKRIDVIYICSNADIARQNIQRLNVTNNNGLNFISFTPGTSFNMSSRGGTAQERAVLFQLPKEGSWVQRTGRLLACLADHSTATATPSPRETRATRGSVRRSRGSAGRH